MVLGTDMTVTIADNSRQLRPAWQADPSRTAASWAAGSNVGKRRIAAWQAAPGVCLGSLTSLHPEFTGGL